MIAFCCKGCGKPMVVEDAHAGDKATCPSCGQAVAVPGRSEAGVLLLRGAEASTVVPIRREEAARRVETGELKPDHAAWQDGEWITLSSVLAPPAGQDTPPAAPPPADSEVELDEIFGPLKPIELAETPPEPEGPPPAAAPASRPRRGGGWLKAVVLLAIILVAGGFVCRRLKLFDKVRLPAALSGLFAGGGFTGADIGNPKIKGSKSGGAAGMTLTAAGSDIWSKADECYFAHRRASGNLTMTVQVQSLTETHEWSKAGLMVREDLSGSGREVSLVVTPKNGAALQVRDALSADSRSTVKGAGAFKAPYWLKLERAGNVFKGSVSKDGTRWELLGEYTVALKPEILAGLCLTSHDAGKPATAKFASFALTQAPGPAAGAPGPNKPR